MSLEEFITSRIEAIEVEKDISISKLLYKMARTAYQGRKLAEAVNVIERMIKDEDITIMLGLAGSMATAGQWKIINWFIENNYVDVLVSTGANISEDIVEAMGCSYYQGSHLVDDEKLFKMGLNRYYDVYGREDDYLVMTELIADFIKTIDTGREYSSREFLYLFGRYLSIKGIHGIVTAAAENKVPVYCPAIADSPYGDAALIAKSRGYHLKIDSIKGYAEFMKLAEDVKDTGVIYIGGGVPKDFIQLFAVTADLLFEERTIPNMNRIPKRCDITNESYYPHKYAVQITTDSPQWGGLSGCTFEEAISWGKETREGEFVQCYCDATIALPIIAHALAERIGSKRKPNPFRFKKDFWPEE
ncbi:MAG: deoxyhypusine synthase family protein [Nitrososphaeria archaeon]